MLTHTLGFPRIGLDRELKRAVERYWRGEAGEAEVRGTAHELRLRHWRLQREAGIDIVPVGDFSYYDHMLDTITALGAVPERYGHPGGPIGMDTYFLMARGEKGEGGLKAMEMTKWFDTNYHYIVPEIAETMKFEPDPSRLEAHIREAHDAGFRAKATLVGPLTFLALSRPEEGVDPWGYLDAVTDCYVSLLKTLSAQAPEWFQIEEPILSGDLPEEVLAKAPTIFGRLRGATGHIPLMVATYFSGLGPNLETALHLPVDALHLDLVRAPGQLRRALKSVPDTLSLSLGVVDGRNIWRTDIENVLPLVADAADELGRERIMVAPSCSLLHTPIDLEAERDIDPEIRQWMAFARQKCAEVRLIADAASGRPDVLALVENRTAMEARRSSKRTVNQFVRRRLASVFPDMARRASAFPDRKAAQTEALGLPLLPTTTIGSFPQTVEIRKARRDFRAGTLTEAEYSEIMQSHIRRCVEVQETLGLDVLVHGEAERNDMVEYFGEHLDGFLFTRNGWVQSYGSRCVKPPVIYGDVSRPAPVTVAWAEYAQSLTDRPMKGMLTGPVTILQWSFVRDDQPRHETCRQIALAIRDEVMDLEDAGIRIIQVDEPALREGLPLRAADRKGYLEWAVGAFRLATCGVRDETQLHTHMCYSQFNEIIRWIAAMDADVISIEASRSGMALLGAFSDYDYPNEIGPGVYDIHSPRVPPREEIAELIRRALKSVSADRLWVNPDCGLKTRDWPETEAALKNMVEAAVEVRGEL